MLTPNPTDDRLRFILKTYGAKRPQVVIDMVSVIANAVGVDRWVEELEARSMPVDPRFAADVRIWGPSSLVNVPGLNPPPPEFLATLVEMVSLMPQFRTRHRADPLFPWMATQLAKMYEPIAMIVAGRSDEEVDALIAKLVGRSVPGGAAAEVYRDVLRKMRRGGTMLAQWYEAKRPNLGQYDFNRAWKEASEWVETEGPVPQGEVVVELSDGWTAQKLTTKEQLNAEGEKMQHCVGSYADEVKNTRTTIYSLRDAKGQPHVTIEVKNDRVQQTQGKQNRKPDAKYEKYVDEFNSWLEDEGVDTAKIPAHLQPYVEALEAHAYDIEDEHLEMYAADWEEHVGDPATTAEWLKSGINYNDAELASALESESVTPEEFVKFPYPVLYKISENGGVPRNLDDLVKVARMALVLEELAPKRDPILPSKQIELFPSEPVDPLLRVPGHDPTGRQLVKSRWGGNKLESQWPSISFHDWNTHSSPAAKDVEWLYPAEEWLAEGFGVDPTDDDYVGPWFIHRFTPEEATEWWELGIEDGEKAAELVNRRVTLKLLNQFEDDENAPYLNLEKATVNQIVDAIDEAGLVRNPGKRTSRPTRRRASRPRGGG
jgi:hypothetical protein